MLINVNYEPTVLLISIGFADTLDHLTIHALYLSRIALELSFRALYNWREKTTHEKRRQLLSMFCINLYTNSLICYYLATL